MNDKVSPSSKPMTDREMLRVCLGAMRESHKMAGRTDWSLMIDNLRRHLEESPVETTARPMLDEQRRKVFSEHLAAAIQALDMRNAYRGLMSPDRAILTSLVEYLEKSPEEPTPCHVSGCTQPEGHPFNHIFGVGTQVNGGAEHG